MSATVNLTGVRFVRRVSNGGSRSKYGYIGMMQENAAAIESSPWIKASTASDAVTLTTNQLTKTDGAFSAETGAWTAEPSYTAYMDDRYDVYAQAGDAVARNATMCGYLGCVAYRFPMPQGETANALEAVVLTLQRDRYLRAGVRVSMSLSADDAPSDNWSVIRGEAAGCVRSASTAPAAGVDGVASFGLLGQPDTPYVLASRAATASVTFDTAAAFASAASVPYLYVYLTLEDPAAYWTMYSETSARQYYIEGSAMLVQSGCSFTFSAAPDAAVENLVFFPVFMGASGSESSWNILPIDGDLSNEAKSQMRQGCDFYSSGAGAFVTPCDQQSCIMGVTDCYSMFFSDSIPRLSFANDVNTTLSTKAAAAFMVSLTGAVSTSGGPEFPASAYSSPFLSRKKVLVPFSLPDGFLARQMRFAWNAVQDVAMGAKCTPPYMQYNVWCLAGEKALNPADPVLQKHELWTAEVDAVSRWRLLDSWRGNYYNVAGTHTSEIKLNLDHGPHTLLLTVYIPLEIWATTETGSAPYVGFGCGLRNSTVRSQGSILVHNGAFAGGWAPDIKIAGVQT